MAKSKKRTILTTSNLRSKKLPSEEAVAKDKERDGISFTPHMGLSKCSPEEEKSSISGMPSRSLPSPWGKAFVVIIAAWNCKKWLGDCLETLANQSLPHEHWGVLVLDDASEDNMERICRRWKVEHIRVKKNRGKSALINLASRILPPETVLVELDADDGLDPRALDVVKDSWEKTPEAILIYTQYALCLEDMTIRKKGHSRQAGTELLEAGYISHLKTYRAQAILDIGFIDESIRKSTDKVLIYRLQELADDTGRPLVFVDEVIDWYRRRKEGSITAMRHYDATEATRNAYKRRDGLSEDTLCVFSASAGNDTGGHGIFWSRLVKYLETEENILLVDHVLIADIVIGNVRISKSIDHQRPWVIRLDGVHFNATEDYAKRNKALAESVSSAEGMIYQSKWGKCMADEYCGESLGETTIIMNGVDSPEGWVKNTKIRRKLIVACSRWGDQRYKRKFKRLEQTVESFVKSGLADKGYTLMVLGEHYLPEGTYSECKGVELKGRVHPDEVHDYLSEAVLFMHLSWMDCCPNGVVEALAAEVPVLYCAEGVGEIVGDAGRKVNDSPLNHPCDTGKPPLLNTDEVAGIMIEMVNTNWGSAQFPDVSMKTCGKKYAEMFRRVYEEGPRYLSPKKESKLPLKSVTASTEDMR